MVRKIFTGGIRMDQDGNYLTDLRGHEYIDEPSPSVDKAWYRLLEGSAS